MQMNETQRALQQIVILAKEGNVEAKSYLRSTYHLKVYTWEELDRLNAYIAEGLSVQEAIERSKQTRKEET